MKNVVVVILNCAALSQTWALLRSSFVKTRVIEDKCFSNPASQEKNLRRSTNCAFTCSQSSDCWRYMACKDSTSNRFNCNLYNSGEDCLVADGTGQGCKCYRKAYTCDDGLCNCPRGFYGSACTSVIKDCIHGKSIYTTIDSGLSFIQPSSTMEPFQVFCDFTNEVTYFQNRNAACSPINFNRTYADYVKGFGNAAEHAEFWLGLERIKAIIDVNDVAAIDLKLDIMMVLKDNPSDEYKQAVYKNLHIGNASENYRLQVLAFGWGTGGDALLESPSVNGFGFSTFDRDLTSYHCPSLKGGGFWYSDDSACSQALMNGPQNVVWLNNFGGKVIHKSYMRIGKL